MAELGALLRSHGLVPRALAAWAGTDRLPSLDAARLVDLPLTPASTALALFVAGVELAVDRAARLPLDELTARGLVERRGACVRATVSILPLRSGLLVCDRADAVRDRDVVCWPDDSSYHLFSAIPRGTYRRWHDLACGSAVAMVARPELGEHKDASDLNPRAVGYARLSATLSGVAIEVEPGDVGRAIGPADLVTCNAPMPGLDGPRWQRTASTFFEALFARREPLIVVHCARDTIPADLPGERLVATYTMGRPAFSVLWWRPRAAGRAAELLRPVTADRPHVDLADLDELSG